MTFKATMVFHVGLTILLLFSFHQKTSPKGHGKRLTEDDLGVSMETWVEQLSAQQTPPPELRIIGIIQ